MGSSYAHGFSIGCLNCSELLRCPWQSTSDKEGSNGSTNIIFEYKLTIYKYVLSIYKYELSIYKYELLIYKYELSYLSIRTLDL